MLNCRRCGPVSNTHRPQSSSFLGLPYRILNMKPKKELLWGLWVLDRILNMNPQNGTLRNPRDPLKDPLKELLWGPMGNPSPPRRLGPHDEDDDYLEDHGT